MALLQHHLGDSEMEMIFSCMDSHGYLTPDQVGADTALGPRHAPILLLLLHGSGLA